ncbi:hypothetical protein V5O48_016093, partial [Marasmius crinis-equi]
VNSRQADGATPESRAAIHAMVMSSKTCSAVDPKSKKRCEGSPIVRPWTDNYGNVNYFVGCSGWSKKFKDSHTRESIPSNVDAGLLAKCLKREKLAEGTAKDTPQCGTIISPRIGRKKRECNFAHIVNGKRVHANILKHDCPTKLTIFTPVDQRIPWALVIFPGRLAHSHPVPPLNKVTEDIKASFVKAVEVHGPVGATLSKVVNAPASKLILGDQANLLNNRKKRDIILHWKREKFPAGRGMPGVLALYLEEQKLPVEERYIHSFIQKDDFTMIVTGLKLLVEFLLVVLSFEADFTFKRVQEPTNVNLNEWEMVVFIKGAQRAATILRVYMNKHDTASYTAMFDEVRNVVFRLTGHPLAMKRFEKEGTLLAVNVDMEVAQVKGIAASLYKTLDRLHSGIDAKSPDDLPPFFLKFCHVHGKRGINDFRPRLDPKTYNHMLTYMDHIKSDEDLAKFDEFIHSIKCNNHHDILNWWAQKKSISWIIPCTVRALSRMDLDDWDATPNHTNTGEGQHAWTNRITGTGLRVVDAIVGAREADLTALKEIQQAIGTGLLQNTQNELVHRESRNATRRHNRAEKTKAADAAKNEQAELQLEIADNQAKSKALKARMKELKSGSTSSGAVPKTRKVPAEESSSSSGRAKSGKTRKTKTATKPNTKGKKAEVKSSDSTDLRELSESEDSELLDLGHIFQSPDASNCDKNAEASHDENANTPHNEPGPVALVQDPFDEAPEMAVDPIAPVTIDNFFDGVDWSIVQSMQGGPSEHSVLDPSLLNLTSFDASSFGFGFSGNSAHVSSFASNLMSTTDFGSWDIGFNSGFPSEGPPSSPPHGQFLPLPPPSASSPVQLPSSPLPLQSGGTEPASGTHFATEVVPAKRGERDQADLSCILQPDAKRQRKLSSRALGIGESALMASAAERAEEVAKEKPKSKSRRGRKPNSKPAK